jgi:hypothetical protein
MEKVELAPGIVSYKNVLDSNTIDTLIFEIEEGMKTINTEWQQSQVQTYDKVTVDTKSRDTQTFGVPYVGETVSDFMGMRDAFYKTLSSIFFEAFDPREKDYKAMFQCETNWHDQYGILKYGIGQKFTNHIDDHKDHHRRISTTFYMNDDYEGGEILFPRFNLNHKPEKNELLIFPSTFVYNHSVVPVTNGTRYAVVSWLR